MRNGSVSCVSLLSALLAGLGACGGSPVGGDELELPAEQRAARWVPLGGDLNPDPAALLSKPSLTGDPRLEPVLGFSSTELDTGIDRTRILRWDSGGWVPLGGPLPEGGPSIGSDGQRRIVACTGGGPFVRRWNGSAWIALGGNISEETGYKGTRYSVGPCGGIVFAQGDTPLVVWSADVGAKANAVYAARWNQQSRKWDGLGPGNIGGRATSVYADIDSQDRLHIAAYTPGGSYGGGATTRVWRWNGSSFDQLGADMPDTDAPVIGVYEDTPYLALHDNPSGAIRVMRWQRDSWRALPSPGPGGSPALGFTESGKLIVAYVESGAPARLRVRYLTGSTWHNAGPNPVAETNGHVDRLDLTVDGRGRPSLAWTEQDAQGKSRLFVRRYSAALP